MSIKAKLVSNLTGNPNTLKVSIRKRNHFFPMLTTVRLLSSASLIRTGQKCQSVMGKPLYPYCLGIPSVTVVLI